MPNITQAKKFFPRALEGFTATIASTAASGTTIVALDNTTGYADGDFVVLAVDPGNSSKQVFCGTIQKSDNTVQGVVWTEGSNVQHNVGATVVDYVTSTDFDLVTTGIRNLHFDVSNYGAVGDGTTDDSAAIQAAFTAAIALGGGAIHFPAGKTYKIVTGISIDPTNLTGPLFVSGYGAIINYTGSADCFKVLTNIAGSDIQHAEKSVHFEGMHVLGTVSATSAFRFKATFCTIKNSVIENFTNITSQTAAIVLDGLFHFWVEECRFESIEIKNTGNGICFISRDESAGTPASIENNYFNSIHIWVAVAGGKGIYGVGLGASTICLISRSIFNGIVVHIFNVANVNAFDFTLCAVEGVVLISPSIDVFGTATNSKGFIYTYSSVLTILGPTNYAGGSVTTMYSGGGAFFVSGGNGSAGTPSKATIDANGNPFFPSLTLGGSIFDANGKQIIGLSTSASAVNSIATSNAATTFWPAIFPQGTDANIGLYLYPKGSSGQVILADQNVANVVATNTGVASAVNYSLFTNAATGNGPKLAAAGANTDIDFNLDGKGAGSPVIGGVSTGVVSLARGALKALVVGESVATLSAQNVTPTAAQLLGGIVEHVTVTAGGTFTLDTGTNISAAIRGIAVGDTFVVQMANTGTQTSTITTNTGLTLQGTVAVPTGKNATLTFRNTGANTWKVYINVSA